MKKWLTLALAIALFCLLVSTASADRLFVANLDALQTGNPLNNSPATGFGTFLLNDTEDQLTINLDFSGLLAPETAAHIHGPAGPGVNAGILIPLPLGTFINFIVPITPVQAGFLKSGLTYVNVHTTLFPGGEIRGQIEPVPEPGTIALVAAGGLPLLGYLRRRKA